MALAITAVLVGAATQPRPVQINVTGLTIGQPYVVTASAAGWSRVVQGGEGVAVATQLVLIDVATPLNTAITYSVNSADLRTNLATDPRATAYGSAANVAGWRNTRWFGGGGGAGAYTLVSGAVDGPLTGVATYARKTWTVAPSSMGNSGDTGYECSQGGVNGLIVTPGQVFTFSSYLRGSVARNYRLDIQEYNGATAGTRKTGSVVNGPAATWVRISYTYTVPASGVTHIQILSDSTADATGAVNWTVGATLDGTALLMEEKAVLGSYFDGATPGAAWTGTAHASTSTLFGPVAPTSSPVSITFDGQALLQSLDGTVSAGFKWMDNADPREPETRNAFYRPSGRSRPIMHYDVAGDDSGQIVARTNEADTIAMRELIRQGAPVLLRCEVGMRDIDPVEVLGIASAPRHLIGSVGGRREWDISYALVSDEDDTPLVMATLDHLNQYYATQNLSDINTQWAGQTLADMNAFDWIGAL